MSVLHDSEPVPLEDAPRLLLANAKVVIIKVGSRVLMNHEDLPAILASQIRRAKDKGVDVVLVSSGAMALGLERLGLTERPPEPSKAKAAASAGQARLMQRYEDAFVKEGIHPAQVLLTHGDLSNRRRVNNARTTLQELLSYGLVPIVNENDVVSTEGLAFSDNDQLAAMVAPLIGADALLLLTDIEGVLDQEGKLLDELTDLNEFIDRGSAPGAVSRGGMTAKLRAARMAQRSGAVVLIADASNPQVLDQALAGNAPGTILSAHVNVLKARKAWIGYTLRPRGTVIIDRGAERAIRDHLGSLLPVGVVGIRGEFRRGDALKIQTLSGKNIGQGLARLSTLESARCSGKRAEQMKELLPDGDDGIFIHRDDLVLWS